MDKQNRAFLTSFFVTGIICLSFLIVFAGCKKKVQQTQYNDNPAPVEQKQETKQTETSDVDSVVWQIQTQYGTYDGHKLEINNGILEFVSSNGYKVYASQPFEFKTKAD